MRRVRRIVELLLVPTIALVAALAIAPQRAELAVHVWLLVVLAIAFVASVGVVRAAYPQTPSPFEASLRRSPAPVELPVTLARLERQVSMAGSSAFDVHFRLRPEIVELASELLSSRRGSASARRSSSVSSRTSARVGRSLSDGGGSRRLRER